MYLRMEFDSGVGPTCLFHFLYNLLIMQSIILQYMMQFETPFIRSDQIIISPSFLLLQLDYGICYVMVQYLTFHFAKHEDDICNMKYTTNNDR